MNTTAASVSSATASESPLWRGSPSQIINLPQYLAWGVIFLALLSSSVVLLRSMDHVPSALLWAVCALVAIPCVVIAWKWLVLASVRYELTTQRFRTRTGVFNKHLEELELYRVRDYTLDQPFFLRLFSLSTITLQTSDKSTEFVVLKAIRGGEAVREQMRTYVEEARMRRGVRELDIDRG